LQKFNMPALFFVATEVLEAKRLLWDNQFFYTLERVGLKKTQDFFKSVFPDENLMGDSVDHVSRVLFRCFAKNISSHEKRMRVIEDFADITKTFAPSTFVQNFYLSAEQIKSMAKAGMAFGAHTHQHALLPTSTDLEVSFELSQSKNALETILNHKISSFCYPSGQFNPAVTAAVGQHYSTAFTTQEHKNSATQNPLLLGRFNVSSQSPHYLAFELSEWKNKLKTILG